MTEIQITPRFIQSRGRRAPGRKRRAPRCSRPGRASRRSTSTTRLGSRLFEAITELPEYYPTRTEAAIFARARRRDRAPLPAAASTLIDLGAGNCAKAVSLFPLLQPKRYVAVDVSVEFLREALRQVQREHPQTRHGRRSGQDFSAGLDLPAELLEGGAPLFFYPGSSIGNFTRDEAFAFLRRVRAQAARRRPADRRRPGQARPVLEAAYDDALGVTAAFNLNAAAPPQRGDRQRLRAARVAPCRASTTRPRRGSRCTSRRARALIVRWPGGERRFAAGERIHTENSYKYTVEGFAALLRDAGFRNPTAWTDPNGWFAVFRAAA